ncbi:MAG: adenosylcobinamide-GDP ribazoletransferase, partial [Proteobacteria bacterium]|nr:adenosylcobinamide-GDP ribazoletransferase [Pseudomonadota bacterium]
LIAWLARRQIGGQTGDVLGASQQAAEVLCLAALVAAH